METRSSPSLQTLHRLARQAAIDDFETMPKAVLFQTLKTRCNVDRLLRLEKRSAKDNTCAVAAKRRKPLYSNLAKARAAAEPAPAPKMTKTKVKLNSLDPIMFTPIGKSKTFIFTRPNGTQVQFLVGSLVDYLLASGDFSDPETRIPFSDKDLIQIDELAGRMRLDKPSVLAARHDSKKYADAKFRRDALLGLERCAGEVIAEMLDAIENFEPEDAQVDLLTIQFPCFADYFRQLRAADAEYASKCIAHWRLFVAGPPNRPNQDDFGLIRLVLQFIKSCDEGRA